MYDYKSSNARKFYYDDVEYKEKSQKAVLKEQKTKASGASRKASGSKSAVMVLIIMIFAAAFLTVKGYVSIYEADNKIADLKEDLRMIEAENQAVKAKVDKSIDLKNLQKTAGEKFGMVRPENYQIFYVDLDFDDYSENVEKESKEENEKNLHPEGVAGVLISSANMFK